MAFNELTELDRIRVVQAAFLAKENQKYDFLRSLRFGA